MQIKFYQNRFKYYIISAVIMVVIIVASFWPGVKFDIEFSGGTMVMYSYDGVIDMDVVETTAKEATGLDMKISTSEDTRTGKTNFQLTSVETKAISTETLENLTQQIQIAFPENSIEFIQNNSRSASMGLEFLLKCIIAVVFAAIIIIIYVAIRFTKIGGLSAGVMGVVALIHDSIVIYGAYVLIGIPLSSNFTTAILTIIGYSINDTIVIYDRVRENKSLHGDAMELPELVNLSINQSFLRSINTTVTTMIALVTVTIVAIFYKVDSIISFALPLTIGMISGVYSTVCLAGPMWVDWKLRKSGSGKPKYMVEGEKLNKKEEKIKEANRKKKEKAKAKSKKAYDKNKAKAQSVKETKTNDTK